MVKYKTEPHTRTEADCSWASTNRLLTNTDLSAYENGDEVQIIIGKGSGKTAHIQDIENVGGGYSILLDETFTDADGTCKSFFDKWKKAGFGGQNQQITEGTVHLNNTSPYIEFKVCIQTTGDTEINSMYITNKQNQK